MHDPFHPLLSADYELLDSGEGEKLERYGSAWPRRPDPQAFWSKSDAALWKTAHATFVRRRARRPLEICAAGAGDLGHQTGRTAFTSA